MKRKLILFSAFFYLSLFLFNIYAYVPPNDAQVTLECSNSNPQKLSTFCISPKISAFEDMSICSMSLEIKFDSSKFSFQKRMCCPKNEGACLETTYVGDTVKIIYMNEKGTPLNANQITDLLDISFKVTGTAEYGRTSITMRVSGVYDSNYREIQTNAEVVTTLNISPPNLSKCMLKSISPSSGSLTPQFKSNLYNYNINVPSDVKEMNFNCVPLTPGCIIKVSRQRLNAAGRSTEFKITVCNPEERNAELIYVITVNREYKESKPLNKVKDSPKNNSERKKSEIKSNKKKSDNEPSKEEKKQTKSKTKSKTKKFSVDNPELYDIEEDNNDDINEFDDVNYVDDEDDDCEDEETDFDREDLDEDDNVENSDNQNMGDTIQSISPKVSEGQKSYTYTLISIAIITILAFAYSLIKVLSNLYNIPKRFDFKKENVINLD